METKPRLNLDASRMRVKPRSYLDSHVPKRASFGTSMSDVVVVTIGSPKVETAGTERSVPEPIQDKDIVFRAKALVDPIPVKEKEVPQPPSYSPDTINTLLQSIQRKHRVTDLPASYESSSLQRPDIEQEEHTISLRTKLWSRLQSSNPRSLLGSAMALLLIVGGIVALLSSAHSNRLVTMQVQALSEKSENASDDSSGQSSSVDVPSEDPVPESVVSSYSVASDIPKYISIPKIKISKTRILRMGVDASGSIKTPRNVWDTGWYEGSSKPSDTTGAALIVGHVSGPTNGGIFYNLYRLAAGDEINVTQGDGTVLTYKVVSKEEVPVDEINMNNYLVSKNVDKAGLTLMTCTGEFNPKTQTFDKRLAVFAIRTN